MQLKKQMYAGLFALMLVAAIVAIPHAVADKQESKDSERKLVKTNADKKESKHAEKMIPARPRQLVVATGVGIGAAIDNDGDLHRSHYRIDLSSTNSTGTNSTDAYQVKKGQIFILEKGSRGTYQIIPETWKIDITDGKSAFSATGQVKNGKGTWNVSLAGEKIRDVKNGGLYRVDGKFSGNDTEYDLHYISTFAKKNRSVESILNATD